jgi:hypothetical protein
MRNITQIVILFSFFSFSCHNNDIQNGILESRIESPNQYVERNVGLIKNLEKFILKNQDLILSNRSTIDSLYHHNIFLFLEEKYSGNPDFIDLINQIEYSRNLNLEYQKYNSDYSKITGLILTNLESNERKNVISFNELGDRKTCLVLYNQNISDCHSAFYREAAVAVLAAGLGGFWGGIVPAFDAAWGLIDCQNRAQRNFDYCLGNI